MINKKNKRVQVTMNPESLELLESLKLRFNLSTSQVIYQALRVLASKRRHTIKVHYDELQEVNSNLDQMIKIVHTDYWKNN